MRTSARKWCSALAGGCVALALCGPADTASAASHPKVVPERGGTLYLLMSPGTPGTLDPSQSYSAASENLSPLFLTPLTAYVPGSNPVKVTGDLATNSGVPSEGARVWTFHLKPGVTYDNGQPVTSYDVKYDVERSFAATEAGGPPYLRMWLQGAAAYKGPYVDKSGLPSVETPNARTIIFKLNQPVADFDYLTTYPEFSGLPQKADTGANYQYHMLTSGPYKIQKYVTDHTLVLVRDPHWKSATDPSIKAYPDKIVLDEGLSPAVIDQRIIADSGNDRYAVPLDNPIQPSDLSQVLSNPAVRQRSEIFSYGGTITYVGLDVKDKPFDKRDVRQAVAWAIDKTTAQTALGGPVGGGPVANEILGPGIPGYKPGNLYGPPGGDVAKAKALLAKAGYPHGFTTTLGTQDIPAWTNAAEAIQTALGKVGIKVKIKQYSQSVYFSGVIGVPKSEPPMAMSAWGSDWDNASTVLPDLLNGSQDTASGPNNDITNFDSPSLDAQMTKAESITDTARANALWAKVDTEAMRQAVIIPLIYASKVFTLGSGVVNGSVNVSFATPDPLYIAVRSKRA